MTKSAAYLLLSFIFIFGVHSYLLISQKNERKWSISLHAAKNNATHALFVLGHLLGGTFFLLFAYSYFVTQYHSYILFGLSIAAVIFEYIQAFLPARDETDKPHTLAAYTMWAFYIVVGLLSLLETGIATKRRLIAAIPILISLAIFIYVHFRHLKLYLHQMTMTVLFFLGMLILAL